MSPTLIAALVADQVAWHKSCRAQEFVEFDGIDSKMTVQCSCNVRLVLTVPKTADPTEPLKATSGIFVTPETSKGDDDVS